MVSVIKSLLLFTTFGAVYSEGDGKWGYVNITRDDVKGPDKWHDLKLDKPNHCGKNKQSPIDIKTSEVEEDSYRRLKITFDNTRGLVTGTLLNTGHSPELEIADSNGASLTGGPLGDNTLELLQFHVHFGCVNERGSEHKLDGKQLSGELHMVFGHDEEVRAVVALWIKASSKGNKIFGKLANLMHHIIKPEDGNTYSVTKEDGIYLMDLIPKKCSIDKREDNGGNGGNGNGDNGNGNGGNGNGDNGNENGGNGNGDNGNGNGGNGNGDNGNGGNGNGDNGNGGNGNGGKDNGVSGKKNNNNNNKNKRKKKKGDPKSLTLKCYFTYRGSLTTPPCTQTIRWIVVKDYVLASTSQLEKFRKLEAKYYGPRMCDNFRPVQNLNDRTVYSVTSEKNNDK